MASTIPNQIRVSDAYSSYNSNSINKISRTLSHGENGILRPTDLQVSQLTDSTLSISSGFAIKDDVLIQILENNVIDFTDYLHYYSPFSSLPQEGGYHYIVLDYTYSKSKPAPTAEFKILKPSERSLVSDFILLKVVYIDNVSPHNIISILDTDPENTSNSRQYNKYYVGAVSSLPSHDRGRDQGRIVYNFSDDNFYLGLSNRWFVINPEGVTLNTTCDTTGVLVGSICYLDENSTLVPAVLESITSIGADVVVTSIFDTVYETLIAGYTNSIRVEPGIDINIGDILYLSKTYEGTVTNVVTSPIYQVVGRALTQKNSEGLIQGIFFPRGILQTSAKGIINKESLIFDGTSSYYYDVDITILDGVTSYLSNWYDATSMIQITPTSIIVKNGGQTLRVLFNTNTIDISYIILGGSPFSEVSVETDHALLTPLGFSESGHTGFAPSTHNNTHHSETYITASDVNFSTLNANGSVGTASNQVAFGNHTHTDLSDISATSIVLFYSDTVISGYTLLTSIDDHLIYITKGSASGGEVGGSIKSGSTWSHPSHTHTTLDDDDHSHSTLGHTLTLDEIPAHTHSFIRYTAVASNAFTSDLYHPRRLPGTTYTSYTGGGGSHTHTSTEDAVEHSHTFNNTSTLNTWRPRGSNFTRQQRV